METMWKIVVILKTSPIQTSEHPKITLDLLIMHLVPVLVIIKTTLSAATRTTQAILNLTIVIIHGIPATLASHITTLIIITTLTITKTLTIITTLTTDKVDPQQTQ
jgi:hypothetical protein